MYKFLLCAKCGSRCNLDAITTLHYHLCSLMIIQHAMVTWYVPQMGLNFIGLMGIKSPDKLFLITLYTYTLQTVLAMAYKKT